MVIEKTNEEATIYEIAYKKYFAANERYENLIQAYKALEAIKEAKEERRAADRDTKDPLPYLGQLMKLMAEEAEKEKFQIAMMVREGLKNLPRPEYVA